MTHRILIAVLLLLLPACYASHTVCDEPGHEADEACTSGFCAGGGTPTYYARAADTIDSSMVSSIEHGDLADPMTMICEDAATACGPLQARVVQPDGTSMCVELPPLCTPGTSPSWTELGWRCDPPCVWRVHYGYMYGGQIVCAGEIPTCRGYDVPQFDLATQLWFCRPACDGGLYDPVYTDDGRMVCVPC